MTIPVNRPDDIADLIKPLPDLEGSTFTQAVTARTKRIQLRRKIVHLITYLCVAVLAISAVPWSLLIAELDIISNALSLITEPVLQIDFLTEWLQTVMNFQQAQTQQIVVIVALTSLICSVTSYVLVEA